MAEVLPSDELTDEPSDFGSLRPGTRLGRYELLVPIARGGMARVWAARQHGQRGFQKLVAIKTILPHLADEPEFERMFLDEARIASGVHHPNVCEIYELGEERRTLYLAMEWVNGDSLSRVLRSTGKSEALDPRVVARIVADACAGVHAAHELADEDGRQLGVVHRDMSPHNVLLSADGTTKVCDFGVAKALGQLHEQTSAGQLKGKISYMSPEQITGAGLDRRSDVFSLGCVLYEATTGTRPFKGARDHEIMNAIMNSTLDPPTSIIRSYPAELERIVLRALAHQPILRYPTAERMRFALEEFLTKGQLVTQSNVAQVVRTRLSDQLEKRKERIRQAQSMAEQNAQQDWDPANVAPSRDPADHRSGVQPSKVFNSTLQMPSLGGVIPQDRSPAEAIPASSHTPRMGAEALRMPTPMLDNEATLHGHGLPASVPTMAAAPRAKENEHRSGPLPMIPAAGSSPMGGPTLTLPIGPGQLMSPFAPNAGGVAAAATAAAGGTSVPPKPEHTGHTPSDFSSPSSHASGPLPSLPPNSAGPNSNAPGSNPYGATAIYDIAQPTQTNAKTTDPRFAPGAVTPESTAEPAGAGQYAMAAIVGLLFAVLIGGGGFFVWQTRTTHTPMPPVATTPVPPTTTAAAPSSTTPPVATASGALAAATASASASSSVPGGALGSATSSSSPASATPSAPASASASAKPHAKPRPKDPNALPDNPY